MELKHYGDELQSVISQLLRVRAVRIPRVFSPHSQHDRQLEKLEFQKHAEMFSNVLLLRCKILSSLLDMMYV